MELIGRIFAAVAAVLLLYFSFSLSGSGFQRVVDFRMLERIPLSSILGATSGETQLKGFVDPSSDVLRSPRTNTESVYFRYKVEKEYRDSDGDRSWRTIRDESSATNFLIDDGSGKATILAKKSRGQIRWSAVQHYRQVSGDYRYTEWRIHPGDQITVFGWLHLDYGAPEVSFIQPGDYLPIVSSFGAGSERRDLGQSAIFYLWGGVSLIVLMCLAIMFALKQHRILLFVGLVTIAGSASLTNFGVLSLESDINFGFERVGTQLKRSGQQTAELLNQYDLEFPGYLEPFDLNSPVFSALTPYEKEKVNSWRISAFQVRERYLQQIAKFPEKPFAHLFGKSNPANIALPEDQLYRAEKTLEEFQPTQLGEKLFITLGALIAIALLAWQAFRLIRIKRMIENVETSKTAGVTFGLCELKGKLIPEDKNKCYQGPVSGKDCTWYHYKIEERRGSGKKARWVTIHQETKKQPFYCEDDEGRLRVFPSQAEVITKHRKIRRSGKKRYTEKRLEPGDMLYLLGKAKVDKTNGDSLVLGCEKGSPFIIANRSELEVMFIKATTAMTLLSFGVSLLFGVGLWAAGSQGSFSSVDFLLASLVAPFFLSVFIAVVMYNDLVFLRKRCERNWANIMVSLKKRHDLIPKLELVVKRYLSHEKDLLAQLANLRSQLKSIDDSKNTDVYMSQEAKLVNGLSVLIEQYPDVEGNKNIEDLNRRLITLENEIALIRDGFNNVVMNYNTRIQSFPDNILAGVFKFERISALQFDKRVHKVPSASVVTGGM